MSVEEVSVEGVRAEGLSTERASTDEVSAEGLRLDEAWGRISPPAGLRSGPGRFTFERMERIMAIVVGVGAIVIGIQALFAGLGALGQMPHGQRVLFIGVLLFLAAMIVACLWGRGVYIFAGTFAIAYVVALALWPFVVGSEQPPAGAQPWVFFLINVATVAAILAFPMRGQVVIVIALPLIYGWVRMVQGEFARGYIVSAAFDVSFTLFLGFVLLTLAWMFRSVALGVDDARTAAVASYSAAATIAAAEQERVAVAALMHDSVMAALIAAERADSDRERELAVVMAREALTRLANAEEQIALEGTDAPVDWDQVLAELDQALAEQGADIAVESIGARGPIPERVMRAVVLAAGQAIRNAIQHAAGQGLRLVAEASDESGFAIMISDTGPGFDIDAISADRLGIRASILARMAAVAGEASVDSDAGGTIVTLRWPVR